MRNLRTAALLLPLALSLQPASARQTPAARAALGRQAASVISLKCLSCHNSEKRAGGIDLTTRATAERAGVLAPGGRLVRAVSEGRMPPSGRLPASEATLLRDWAAAGAAYPIPKLARTDPAGLPLWSFQPVRKPSVPPTPFDKLAANPIDRFVFAKLAAKGLGPSPPADRLTLIRRVTVDLTGLPPTPDEIDAFLKDRSPNAYEKVVDRLLASTAYGERWARHWLDVVRYGESNGYEQNHLRMNAWPYRDYVIRAFNQDKPWTDFVVEQLAGDYVGKGNPDVEAATGFLVAGVHDTVGIQEEQGTRQQRSNDLDDIVSTTGAAFLGLTVGCAKCHDHKFDPVPQRDFYRLAACFAGVRHGERPLFPRTPEQTREMETLSEKISAANDAINALDAEARTAATNVSRQRGTPFADRPAVSARRNEDTFPAAPARFVRFTITTTRDNTEPCLDELQVFGPAGPRNLALALQGAKATASSLLPGFAVHTVDHLNDGKFGNEFSWISATRSSGWARIELPRVEPVNRVVWSRDGAEIPRFDDRLATAYRIEISLDGTTWKTVSTEMGRAGSSDYVHPDQLLRAMSDEQRKRRTDLKAELERLKQDYFKLNNAGNAYIGQFTEPDTTYLLRRGDVMQRGDIVKPGPLSQCESVADEFEPLDDKPEPERRLALAKWIADEKNPLTARVIVNRVWQGHFGRGIVGTPSDFGRNGERPTHPELLDWLASEFSSPSGDPYACGWRLKKLHKTMVMSYTYRQSPVSNPHGTKADAGNQLLWRGPLRRMEAEPLRDAVLQTSGKLDRRMGGPGYLLYKYRVVNVAIYEPLEQYGPETWRRSIYQQAARGIHDELLSTFDCPESSQRAPKRDSTTTALQSLAMLNGPFLLQQAGFFAARVTKEAGPSPDAQVRRAFTLAFGRPPDAAESRDAAALVKRLGLPALCRALLNASEFMYY